MKKLNNKGITIVEVLVCFVLVVIVAMSLFSTISAYNDKRMTENYKTRIYSYKNLLTKDIQDDFITIGLTNAKYTRKVDNSTKKVTHTVDCNLADGTKRKLVVTQRFTQSIAHPEGNPTLDDEFIVKYGDPDREMENYELPDLGSSYVKTNASGKVVSCNSRTETGCREQKDLSINNILIEVTQDYVLSIYIGFYHPELSTRYGINIVAPIDFTSKLSDMSSGLDIPVPEEAKYTVRFVLGEGATGSISPVTVPVGEVVRMPYATVENGVHKDGATLIGWTTSETATTGYDYSVGSNQRFSNDTTLYAVWEPAKESFSSQGGALQVYEVPANGTYLLQAWGAAGGALSADPSEMGYGGYIEAKVTAKKGTFLYVLVGGKGKISDDEIVDGGENGGGRASQYVKGGTVGSGGGATSISNAPGTETGKLPNNTSFLLVAGGGGGSYYKNGAIKGKGGSGGGFVGESGQQSGEWKRTLENYKEPWSIKIEYPGCAYGGFASDCDEIATPEVITNFAKADFPMAGAGNGFCGGFISGEENTGAGGGSSYLFSNTTDFIIKEATTSCYNCFEYEDGREETYQITDVNINNTPYILYSKNGRFNHSSTLDELDKSRLNSKILSSGDGFAMITFLG